MDICGKVYIRVITEQVIFIIICFRDVRLLKYSIIRMLKEMNKVEMSRSVRNPTKSRNLDCTTWAPYL